MLICYDVEFPENVRRLARAGADAVLVPTALPDGHAAFIAGKHDSRAGLREPAVRRLRQPRGADGRFAYAGLSLVAAPDGSLLAEAAGGGGEALLIADLRSEDFAASASENTYLADLRV